MPENTDTKPADTKPTDNTNTSCDINRVVKFIVIGMVVGGYEGGFNNCCKSSAGDYPSFGIGGWEGIGSEGDQFLSRMAAKDSSLSSLTSYAGKSYSELEASGELKIIQDTLETEAGKKAQTAILAEDFPGTYWGVMNNHFPEFFSLEPRSQIYIGMWMNTGPNCCAPFIKKRPHDDFETVYKVFKEEYGPAAVSSEYWDGYANRADGTYDYVKGLDLTKDPDPSMIVDSSKSIGNGSSPGSSGGSGRGNTGSGFKKIYIGEKTVRIIKLPEGKTVPFEPIYPDLITVSDTIPEWALNAVMSDVNTNSSSSSSEINNLNSSDTIIDTKKNLEEEFKKFKETRYQLWLKDNGYTEDVVRENPELYAQKYNQASSDDSTKFIEDIYTAGDKTIIEEVNNYKTKIKELEDKIVSEANKNKDINKDKDDNKANEDKKEA